VLDHFEISDRVGLVFKVEFDLVARPHAITQAARANPTCAESELFPQLTEIGASRIKGLCPRTADLAV
jgi:hypothetical protein